jgi:hypothetical protein
LNISKYGPLFVFGAFLATLAGYIALAFTGQSNISLETLENILIGFAGAIAALAVPKSA